MAKKKTPSKKPDPREVKNEEVFKPDCFAYAKIKMDGCEILRGVRVPRDCKTCKFKKHNREYTDGTYYPYIPGYNK